MKRNTLTIFAIVAIMAVLVAAIPKKEKMRPDFVTAFTNLANAANDYAIAATNQSADTTALLAILESKYSYISSVWTRQQELANYNYYKGIGAIAGCLFACTQGYYDCMQDSQGQGSPNWNCANWVKQCKASCFN